MAESLKSFYKSKTLWVAVAGVLYSLTGYFTGNIEGNQAVLLTVNSLGLAGLRDALGIKWK